jgi:hypothetical protein
MSKKTKRQARKSGVETTPSYTPAATLSSNGNKPFERDFNPDYTPVIKDLKRIGALAGSFFVILIILSFFLR